MAAYRKLSSFYHHRNVHFIIINYVHEKGFIKPLTLLLSRSSATPSATSSRTSRLGRRGTIDPFNRDLILLSGPDDKNVPRQGTKVFLQESGHIINAFQFMKEWSDVELILQIAEAFKR